MINLSRVANFVTDNRFNRLTGLDDPCLIYNGDLSRVLNSVFEGFQIFQRRFAALEQTAREDRIIAIIQRRFAALLQTARDNRIIAIFQRRFAAFLQVLKNIATFILLTNLPANPPTNREDHFNQK